MKATWASLVAGLVCCLLVADAQGRQAANHREPKPLKIGAVNNQVIQKNASVVHQASADRRLRTRSKYQSTYNKEGPFLKRIVAEVIAERDAQIAAALFEVAKNQPHLQMMVQTLGELSQSNQRLELSSTRLDETQRRLDSRMGVISEKMSLLETRLGQTERRIEREMTHVHGKMDDFLRTVNVPEKSSESVMRTVKQLQNQLTLIEELVAERTPINKLKSKSRPGKNLAPLAATSSTSTEMAKWSNNLSQALAAAHDDLVRVIGEAETNINHQLSMLASDNGVLSCAVSKLMERTLLLAPADAADAATVAGAGDSYDNNATLRCVLKCP